MNNNEKIALNKAAIALNKFQIDCLKRSPLNNIKRIAVTLGTCSHRFFVTQTRASSVSLDRISQPRNINISNFYSGSRDGF